MQAFRMVDDLPGKIGFDSGLDFLDIGQDRLDAADGQCIMRASTHAASQQNLAIGDRVHHSTVAVLGSRVISVAFPGLVGVHFLISELAVIGLGTILLRDDLSILDGEYLVILSAPEVSRNGFEIIGNDCNFHGFSLFLCGFCDMSMNQGI
jgi:hypothetical protein